MRARDPRDQGKMGCKNENLFFLLLLGTPIYGLILLIILLLLLLFLSFLIFCTLFRSNLVMLL